MAYKYAFSQRIYCLRSYKKNSVFESNSSLIRRQTIDYSHQLGISRQIHRPVLQRLAGWVVPQKVAVFPVFGRPNRPLHKPTAAVWAGIALQNRLNAGGAKRAFVTADAGFE
jgi:hypothetical protein